MKRTKHKDFLFLLLSVLLGACHPKSVNISAPDISSISSGDTLNWKSLGPFGSPIPNAGANQISPHGTGRFMCVLTNPSNPDELIAGHASAGIFKTNNGGKSWEQVMHLGIACGVFKIMRLKSDPKHLLACTALDIGNSRQYGYGVIESFDGGNNWVRNSLSFEPEEYALDQTRDLVSLDQKKDKSLLAITGHKVYISNNGALNWQMTYETTYNLKHIAVHPNNPKIIIISGNAVLLSVDGGYTFTDLSDKINRAYGLKNHVHTQYFSAFSLLNPNKIYIAAQNQTVHLLSAELPEPEEFELINSNFAPYNASRLAFTLQEDKSAGKEIFWIGTSKLVKSDDGGIKFREMGTPLNASPNHMHDDLNDIQMTPDGHILVCTDGGIDISADNGLSWRSLTDQSLNLNAALLFGFDYSPDHSIMAGTQDNGIILYKNGQWTCLPLYGDGGRVVSMSDSDDFSAGFAQLNYFISNKGRSFSMMHAGFERTGHDFRMQYLRNSKTLYIANMHLYKKQNGKYFEILSSSLDEDRKIKAFYVNPNNEREIWLAKDDPSWGADPVKKLWHTIDGGLTWIDRSSALPILKWRSITDITMNKRGEIAISLEAFDKKGGELNKVYFSLDGGRTFYNQSAGLPNLPVNCLCFADKKWLCGTNDGVYIFYNKLWHPLGNQLPKVIVSELKYFSKDKVLLASTFGRGLWSISLN